MSVINSPIKDKRGFYTAHNSRTLAKYKEDMTRIMNMYVDIDQSELSEIIDFSISKRLHDTPNVLVENNYEKKTRRSTLLQLTDWIMDKEPIVTAHGTMFKKHGKVPNPQNEVIQLFLNKRIEDKNKMFEFPKGSEMYEKYNLFQQLDKIDCNGYYIIAPLGRKSQLVSPRNLSGNA